MNRYKFKVTYITGRSETYEIEAAQQIDAYAALIDAAFYAAFYDADENEIVNKIELVEFDVIWELDEGDLEEQ